MTEEHPTYKEMDETKCPVCEYPKKTEYGYSDWARISNIVGTKEEGSYYTQAVRTEFDIIICPNCHVVLRD
jgi:predicted HNH restriction endonuclease